MAELYSCPELSLSRVQIHSIRSTSHLIASLFLDSAAFICCHRSRLFHTLLRISDSWLSRSRFSHLLFLALRFSTSLSLISLFALALTLSFSFSLSLAFFPYRFFQCKACAYFSFCTTKHTFVSTAVWHVRTPHMKQMHSCLQKTYVRNMCANIPIRAHIHTHTRTHTHARPNTSIQHIHKIHIYNIL